MKTVEESKLLAEGIAQATSELALSVTEVTAAVRQMDVMTQHNAALAEQTNAAIEQTEHQALQLDRIVARLQSTSAATAFSDEAVDDKFRTAGNKAATEPVRLVARR